MLHRLFKRAPLLLLWSAIVAYALYFSIFTVARYQHFYTHYFDLGIMHQTVYNTYKAFETVDLSRILEMTNPHDGADQVKRMAVHNDVLLAFLAPFYFIYPGPETLLVIQSVALALGAYAVYQIAFRVLIRIRFHEWLALLFAFAYLLYPPMHRTNNFEFHAVALATPLLLYMYLYWLEGKYKLMLICAGLAILSKEQVGLTVAGFTAYALLEHYAKPVQTLLHTQLKQLGNGVKRFIKSIKRDNQTMIMVTLGMISVIWVAVSMALIIPGFRGENHFGSSFYHHLLGYPWEPFAYLLRPASAVYLKEVLGPYGFLSLLSPLHLVIILPEFMVNLLSSNANMRNIYFHYTAVLHAFIVIAAIYGYRNLIQIIYRYVISIPKAMVIVLSSILLIVSAGAFTYVESPLPFMKQADLYAFKALPKSYDDVTKWQKVLAYDQIKVSSTGHLAPHFSSRQYFYDFVPDKYIYAEYVVVDPEDALNGYLSGKASRAYAALQKDTNYIKIYDRNQLEVYKKITND